MLKVANIVWGRRLFLVPSMSFVGRLIEMERQLAPMLILFLRLLVFIFPFLVDSFQFTFGPLTSSRQPLTSLSLFAEKTPLMATDEEPLDWTETLLPDRRRALLSSSVFLSGCAAATRPARAAGSSALSDLVAPQKAESSRLDNGLLEVRVTENVMSPPPYGMEGSDIFYPSWFAGVWDVSSTTTQVEAPCGVPLFGGNATYKEALNDIGKALTYQSRFIPDGRGAIIADREYNVKAIAKAAMGSFVDVSTASPNRFSCILSSPKGSPSMLSVDLIVLARRQEQETDTKFDCSEVVRQIVSPLDDSSGGGAPGFAPKRSSLLKEIETTSLYTALTSRNKSPDSIAEIQCRQRSAAFLLPSQDNPMAMKAWEYSRGRPIDVRFYDVAYTKAGG